MIFAFFLSAAIIMLVLTYQPSHKSKPLTLHLAKLSTVRIPCAACGKALDDDALVTWKERGGQRASGLYHAACVVAVRHPDGMVTGMPDGSARPDGWSAVELSAEEWEQLSTRQSVEIEQ